LLRRIFACARPAKIGLHPVSQKLRDVALQSRNLSRYRIRVGPHDLAQFLGIETAAEVGGSDEVDEHERELTSLDRRRGPRRRQVRWQQADCIENLPPMAYGLDSNLLEIFNRQMGQDLKVNSVVPERLLIGLQAQGAQPFSDVQLRLRWPLNYGFLSGSRSLCGGRPDVLV